MKDERNTQRRRRRRRNDSVRQSVAGPSSWSLSSGLVRLQYFSDRKQEISRILSAFCAAVKKYCRLLSLSSAAHAFTISFVVSWLSVWFLFLFCRANATSNAPDTETSSKNTYSENSRDQDKCNRHSWRFFSRILVRNRMHLSARPFSYYLCASQCFGWSSFFRCESSLRPLCAVIVLYRFSSQLLCLYALAWSMGFECYNSSFDLRM